MRHLLPLDRLREALLTAVALTLSGCRGCGSDAPEVPAGPRETELVKQALSAPARYYEAVEELEKTPAPSLRAVRQAGAEPGTRRALLLQALEDRIEHPGTYASWQARVQASTSVRPRQIGPSYADGVNGLAKEEHALFWSEGLLIQGDETTQALAAQKLQAIGGAVARHSLAIRTRNTNADVALGLRAAAAALAALDGGQELADSLAAWQGTERPEAVRGQARAILRYNLQALSPAAGARSAGALLDALARQPLADAQRRGYLEALSVLASPDSLEQLAALRRAPWAAALQPEIDAVISAVVAKQAIPAVPKGVRP